jgi:glutamine synthetase adenylyltransferase
VALVALVLAAPRLSDMLARQPQIMDGLIDPRFSARCRTRRIVLAPCGDTG